MFERADWTLFRNLNTISQKAGVKPDFLRRLIMKELVDNALDATRMKCEFGKIGDNGYFVEDQGPGIPGTPDQIAHLFSINRPLTSSKILRLPSRGALGNGLRVVVGTVMATGGRILVFTRRQKIALHLDDKTGLSTVEQCSLTHVTGTRIELHVGNSVKSDRDDLLWANLASSFHIAKHYDGKSSAWWYDSDSFYELLMAADGQKITWLVPQFDGVKKGDINKVILGLPIDCAAFDRDQADVLLGRLRCLKKAVSPKSIGCVDFSAKKYGEMEISPGRGKYSAQIPYLVESYSIPINEDPTDDSDKTDDEVHAFINATPITGELRVDRLGKARIGLWGCGLHHRFDKVSRRKCSIYLNVTTPYMPITTDGKEPNFLPMYGDIESVISKGTRHLKTALKKQSGGGQRDIILSNLRAAINAASGEGEYRFSLRQLFYAVRPYVLSTAENQTLDYNYFCRVITEFEGSAGTEIPGIYRDPRGTLYHPHLGRSIPIGTIAVEEYQRPKWTFNKILYCEKEGFFSVLNQVQWPERNDCALLSSKGFASRAVRDVLDLLGETDEEIQFFCIHDADASGTLIYQALTEGTTARAARKVKIINLGLDPWTAVDMGLQVETFESKKGLPVANYVRTHDDENDLHGRHTWRHWLQTRRVELNAMTSPAFLAWLDEQIKPHTKGKVIPPEHVLRETLKEKATFQIREGLTAEILKAGNFESRVREEIRIKLPAIERVDIGSKVRCLLNSEPEKRWDAPIDKIAGDAIK